MVFPFSRALLLSTSVAALYAGAGAADAYAIGGNSPVFVADFAGELNSGTEYYRSGGSDTTFSSMFTYTGAGNKTMVDSDGVLKWAPHNYFSHSNSLEDWAFQDSDATISGNVITATSQLGNQTPYARSITVDLVTGGTYRHEFVVSNVSNIDRVICTVISFNISGEDVVFRFSTVTVPFVDTNISNATIEDLGSGEYLCGYDFILNGTDNTGQIQIGLTERDDNLHRLTDPNGTETVTITKNRLYRKTLGGMVDNPDTGDSYVPTTTDARFLPRRNHYIYNGTSWEKAGILLESVAATNLLHTTNTFVTQSVTVTAVPHTLSFTGTGTVTLSGASTAGPLVGTGTGENNRVSLTFTPSAGSLTLTVSGTVTNAQLEVGQVRTSYIPNVAASGTVTRVAETLSTTAVSYSGTASSVHWKGYATYADDNGAQTYSFIRWLSAATDYFALRLNTQSTSTGRPSWIHVAGGVSDVSFGVTTQYAPGVNVPMNMAARSTTSTCQVGAEGVANTADNTVTAMPTGLGSAAFELTQATDLFPRTVSLVRKWTVDIGSSGLATATS